MGKSGNVFEGAMLFVAVCCLYVNAQLSLQPGIGLGPFKLKSTFQENDRRLHWKNVEVRRSKADLQNVFLIYRAEGITFFYTQPPSQTFQNSVLDSIEVTSPLFKVSATELSVGKVYKACEKQPRRPVSDLSVSDTAAIKGIRYFYDSACTIALIRIVPK